jgi:hypothetical protein
MSLHEALLSLYVSFAAVLVTMFSDFGRRLCIKWILTNVVKARSSHLMYQHGLDNRNLPSSPLVLNN